MRRVLVLGATSAIAQATARRLLAADPEARFVLVGRARERVEAVAADLRVRGAPLAEAVVADLDDPSGHEPLVAAAEERLGAIDLALLAQGVLGDPEAYRADPAAARRVLETNLVNPVSLLTAIARRMRERGAGAIVGISSVAGDRGRGSNHVYGAAKAGLTAYLSGLRNWLHQSGVAVVTVKPGFVDTPMTAHLEKGPLFVGPDAVARGIVRAVERRHDVVYLPWFWRPIMLVIQHLPERVFKKMRRL